uniref:SLED domain-containing protein n=1 Tax=Romanomermis culicivorax TaxID=13658 RepID=A0A915KYA2_ROMCU
MHDDSVECVISGIMSECLNRVCSSLRHIKEVHVSECCKDPSERHMYSQFGVTSDNSPKIRHSISSGHSNYTPANGSFSWENYLQINGCCPCDQVSNFPHISESFDVYPRLKLGQYVGYYCREIINNLADTEEKTFWPCRLISLHGDWAHLLPFRAKNSEDSMFWKLISRDCAPIDSLINNDFECSTSFDVIDNNNFIHGDELFHVLPKDDCAVAADFTRFDSDFPVDDAFGPKRAYELIKIGQYVEIQEPVIGDPRRFWICKILDNVCGRLLLEYMSLEEDSILNVNIPRCILLQSKEDIEITLAVFVKLDAKRPLKKHNLEVDMKLEALHPLTRTQFYPANISEILNEYYFVVELDLMYSLADESVGSRRGSILPPDVPQSPLQTCLPRPTSLKIICHKESTGIFPVGWCAQKRLRLSVSDEFDWSSYLKRKGGRMLNEHHLLSENHLIWRAEFHRGQKFECVYPSPEKDKICVATVIRFIKPLLWVYFDSWPQFAAPIILHCLTTDLFPCGWCSTCQYPLDIGPSSSQILKDNYELVNFVNAKYVSYEKKFADTPNYAFMPRCYMPKYGCQWSSCVFINTKCYVGPYLSRSRLSEMPRQIGPGPLVLVLKKVFRFVISSAYKPRDLFAEFQPDLFHYTNPFRDMIEIKAKFKGKRWRGMAEICKKTEHVDEWCRQLCEVLDACPSLISVKYVPDVENCAYRCSKAVKNRYAGTH